MKKVISLVLSIVMLITITTCHDLTAFAKNDLLVDNAKVLSKKQYDYLIELQENYSALLSFDIVIVLENSIGNKSMKEYADNYYDNNGYGQNDSNDGCLLLIDFETRNWCVSTCGYGITAIDDNHLRDENYDEYFFNYAPQYFVSDLSDSKYFSALYKYIELINDFVSHSKNYSPYSYNNPCTFIPTFNNPLFEGCVADLQRLSWNRYEGNMGDSYIYDLDEQGYPSLDSNNEYCRYGNIGLNGEKFSDGFEVWLARWNYQNEISWVESTYDLSNKYCYLTGKIDLIKSYNTTSFDTTIYFYNGEELIKSYQVTNENYRLDISVNVNGVESLRILAMDNSSTRGGTSIALYDLMLVENPNEDLSINDYAYSSISNYYGYIMSTEGPVGPLMDDAWDVNKLANAFVQSSSHLFNGKTTDQSIQEYYDAVLYDLIANTYSLPDFDSYMEKQFKKLQNSMINYFIGQGFDLTKDISNGGSNFGLFYDYVEELMGSKMSSYQLTYEIVNSIASGCKDATECIDLLSQYILVHEQGKELEAALTIMKSYADNDNFRKALDDVIQSLSMTPQQYVDKIVAEKMGEYGLTLVEKVAEKIVKDIIVRGFKIVFPLAEIKLIIEITSYLCDSFFATTVNSNQQYRLYIYIKIENACKKALEAAYNYGTSSEVSSCYEMYLRIYEHEIRECLNFADIYFNQGLFNQIKNYMKLGGGSYENAVDWINSYRYPLNNLKTIKSNAQKQWGIDTGTLVYLYEICMFDGMIAGFHERTVDTGYQYNKPSDSVIENYIHIRSDKNVSMDSVYYDEEMKNEIQTFPILINENTAIYYNLKEIDTIIDGWISMNGFKYYYKNGIALTGKQTIDGKTYFFNSNGAMRTGWIKDNNKWYYTNSDGVMQTGWIKSNGNWYYMSKSGTMITGWAKIGSIWYFMNNSGAMQKGWQKINGTWYYFKSSGAMVTGWQKIGSTWYYFQSSGAMQTGWLKSGGKWYYFESSGAMLANTSKRIGSKTYKFNSSGACTNP